MKKSLVWGVVLIVGVVVAFVVWRQAMQSPQTSVSPSISASPVREANIIVTSPIAGTRVDNPITVTGRARVFESQFNWRLKSATGGILAEGIAMANAPDMGMYGDFTIKIPVPLGQTSFIVEVFDYSAKDGSLQDLVRIPVTLATAETSTVKAFFSNSVLDPEVSCQKTFPVERQIVKTKEVAYLALTELLKGPTAADKKASYTTSIPFGVKINSLVIRGTTAYADFNSTLDYQIGGSCRVSAISHQIVDTLKQFSSIKNVVISIDGRTEDILQP
jgi:hypothetical protein